MKFLKDAVLSVTTPSSQKPWVGWLSRTFENPNFTPVDEQSQAIYCPVWLLNNRVAKCGQIARLAADGLSLVGIKDRVVQLSAHVVAEAFQDGRWIMLDPNRLRKGYAGHSVAELMRDEKRVDDLLPHLKSREPVMKDDEARSTNTSLTLRCGRFQASPFRHRSNGKRPRREKNSTAIISDGTTAFRLQFMGA